MGADPSLIRSSALVIALLAPLLLTGCMRFGPPCALTIAAIPSGAGAVAGQRLPEGALVIASPADFVPRQAEWGETVDGLPTVTIQMGPEAAARMDTYSSNQANLGQPLAIAIDKTIFLNVILQAPITDGRMTIVPASGEDAARMPTLFEGCVATPTGMTAPTPVD
jgi:hypothetical protein